MSSGNSEKLNLGRLFLNAFRWMDASFIELLGDRGWRQIPKSNSLVFPHLLDGGIRPAEIARRAGVSRQAIHQVLGDLRKKGLVEMRPDPTNRRAKLVFLTARGKRFDAAVGDAASRLEQALADRIGSGNVHSLREALEAEWGPPMKRGVDSNQSRYDGGRASSGG